MITIHPDSHTDHGIAPEQLRAALEMAGARLPESGVAVVTVELPEPLGAVPCTLYGPAMGDDALSDEQTAYMPRPGRDWPSRLCPRPVRQTRLVTVVAGPHDGLPWVLFTAYGGPAAPREPADPSWASDEEADAFWARHALAPTDTQTRLVVALEVLASAAGRAVGRGPYSDSSHWRLERAIEWARAVLAEVAA